MRALSSLPTQFGVVGTGQMGNGIAITAAMVGKFDVIAVDVAPKMIENARVFAEKLLGKNVAKGKMTEEEMAATLERLHYTTDFEALQPCGAVVEAATENTELKLDIFRRLDALMPAEALLATNTSSISITKVAAATTMPERVMGLHFMNPVPVQKLVEVIRGLETSDETYARGLAIAEAMGKVTVTARDAPGFIVNRILMPYINEAAIALYENLGTAEGIDAGMKLGCALPMGPLLLADFIGLDTCLSIMEVLHKELGDSKYRPATLLKQYVEAGRLGVKTGRGFHDHGRK
jgi:3-hydroxybutyryl-CoA dehydrogenase